MKSTTLSACSLVLLLSSPSLLGATAAVDAKVERLLFDDESYGQCMIYLSVSPSDSGLACPGKYVTLDCEGSLGASKSVGQQKLGAAQLAYVTGGDVRAFVDDSRTINGKCYVDRLDNLPQ